MEPQYYNPKKGIKGGRIVTEDICAICYNKDDIVSADEIRANYNIDRNRQRKRRTKKGTPSAHNWMIVWQALAGRDAQLEVQVHKSRDSGQYVQTSFCHSFDETLWRVDRCALSAKSLLKAKAAGITRVDSITCLVANKMGVEVEGGCNKRKA
eukprot:15347680-Ditylum_brightwellii.AAC.1